MRHTITVLATIAALILCMAAITASISSMSTVSYPAAMDGKKGTVSGYVVSSHNAHIDGANVSIVNASDPGQVYATAKTDSNGYFKFQGVNCTFDSATNKYVDYGGTVHDIAGGMLNGNLYKVSADKGPYGGAISDAFGLDAATGIRPNVVVTIPVNTYIIDFTAERQTIKPGETVKLTALVHTAGGQPAPDGTHVDFVVMGDASGGWSSQYGSVGNSNDRRTMVTTSQGKAVTYYGWLPADPLGDSSHKNKITACLRYASECSASLNIGFTVPSPSPTLTPTPTIIATARPTLTPVPATVTVQAGNSASPKASLPVVAHQTEVPSATPGMSSGYLFPVMIIAIVLFILVAAALVLRLTGRL